MCLEIRKLSVDDGRDIYEMLQELPADKNSQNVHSCVCPNS